MDTREIFMRSRGKPRYSFAAEERKHEAEKRRKKKLEEMQQIDNTNMWLQIGPGIRILKNLGDAPRRQRGKMKQVRLAQKIRSARAQRKRTLTGRVSRTGKTGKASEIMRKTPAKAKWKPVIMLQKYFIWNVTSINIKMARLMRAMGRKRWGIDSSKEEQAMPWQEYADFVYEMVLLADKMFENLEEQKTIETEIGARFDKKIKEIEDAIGWTKIIADAKAWKAATDAETGK